MLGRLYRTPAHVNHSQGIKRISAHTTTFNYSLFPNSVVTWSNFPPHMDYLTESHEFGEHVGDHPMYIYFHLLSDWRSSSVLLMLLEGFVTTYIITKPPLKYVKLANEECLHVHMQSWTNTHTRAYWDVWTYMLAHIKEAFSTTLSGTEVETQARKHPEKFKNTGIQIDRRVHSRKHGCTRTRTGNPDRRH